MPARRSASMSGDTARPTYDELRCLPNGIIAADTTYTFSLIVIARGRREEPVVPVDTELDPHVRAERHPALADVGQRPHAIVEVDVADRANAYAADVEPGEGVQGPGGGQRDAGNLAADARAAHHPRADHRPAALVALRPDQAAAFGEGTEQAVAVQVGNRRRHRCLPLPL